MNINLGDINLGIRNILDGQGIDIAITGMLVVFAALALISTFIAILPSILWIVNTIYPPEEESHAQSGGTDIPEDEILAAIWFALHTGIENNIPDK